MKPEYDGKFAVIDGFDGKIYIDPDEETLAAMKKKQAEDIERKKLLEQLKGKENVTLSGQHINIYANIGNSSECGSCFEK